MFSVLCCSDARFCHRCDLCLAPCWYLGGGGAGVAGSSLGGGGGGGAGGDGGGRHLLLLLLLLDDDLLPLLVVLLLQLEELSLDLLPLHLQREFVVVVPDVRVWNVRKNGWKVSL